VAVWPPAGVPNVIHYQGPCCDGVHQWHDWVWAMAQYPARGKQLESVWTRVCPDCQSVEVRRTRANQRPTDDGCPGTILSDRPSGPLAS